MELCICKKMAALFTYVGPTVHQSDVIEDATHSVLSVSNMKQRLNTEQRRDQIPLCVFSFIRVSPRS